MAHDEMGWVDAMERRAPAGDRKGRAEDPVRARQAANDVHRKQAAAEWRLDVRATVALENGRRARGYVWNEDAIMAREAHVLS